MPPAPEIADGLPLTDVEKKTLAIAVQNLANARAAQLQAMQQVTANEGAIQGAVNAILSLRGLEGNWELRDERLFKR